MGVDSAAGSFVHTLTLTDVASGWTECVAHVVPDGALVKGDPILPLAGI
jgi:hypothetical protein